MVTEEVVLQVINELTENGREFHTTELSIALTNHLGAEIDTAISRYWANQMVLKGILQRRHISRRLFVYGTKSYKSINLPASVTINKP